MTTALATTTEAGGMTYDLTDMPNGERYEDTYGEYLDVFKRVAEARPGFPVTVVNPPVCWIPLLVYLGATIKGWQCVFEHDRALTVNIDNWLVLPMDRTAVEVWCGFRPELVDALWKCDMEWDVRRVHSEERQEFIVTTNGAFHRKEVLAYLDALEDYVPEKKRFVLVPCAADKPYPSPLHKAVLATMPDDYELIVATGVLGLVPQALWRIAPYYDSGIPNEWRLFNIAQRFFAKAHCEHVIAYTDFYSHTINKALGGFSWMRLDFVDDPIPRKGYLDLLAPERLERLQQLYIRGQLRLGLFE